MYKIYFYFFAFWIKIRIPMRIRIHEIFHNAGPDRYQTGILTIKIRQNGQLLPLLSPQSHSCATVIFKGSSYLIGMRLGHGLLRSQEEALQTLIPAPGKTLFKDLLVNFHQKVLLESKIWIRKTAY